MHCGPLNQFFGPPGPPCWCAFQLHQCGYDVQSSIGVDPAMVPASGHLQKFGCKDPQCTGSSHHISAAPPMQFAIFSRTLVKTSYDAQPSSHHTFIHWCIAAYPLVATVLLSVFSVYCLYNVYLFLNVHSTLWLCNWFFAFLLWQLTTVICVGDIKPKPK